MQSTLGVAAVHPADPSTLQETLRHLTTDLPPAGIKIGMLATAAIVDLVAGCLQGKSLQALPVVLDPILAASSGTPLLDAPGIAALQAALLPQVNWITPNWRELSLLTGERIQTLDDVHRAMNVLGSKHPHLHIVATAGDQPEPTDLLRTPDGTTHAFAGTHLSTNSTHGTGCAFSSALLSCLVLGDSPTEAVTAAKAYVTGAIRHAPGLGHGKGPLDLLWPLRTTR